MKNKIVTILLASLCIINLSACGSVQQEEKVISDLNQINTISNDFEIHDLVNENTNINNTEVKVENTEQTIENIENTDIIVEEIAEDEDIYQFSLNKNNRYENKYTGIGFYNDDEFFVPSLDMMMEYNVGKEVSLDEYEEYVESNQSFIDSEIMGFDYEMVFIKNIKGFKQAKETTMNKMKEAGKEIDNEMLRSMTYFFLSQAVITQYEVDSSDILDVQENDKFLNKDSYYVEFKVKGDDPILMEEYSKYDYVYMRLYFVEINEDEVSTILITTFDRDDFDNIIDNFYEV